MKLKLDENLDVRLAVILRQAGHEVATVRDQGLAGIDDQALFATARQRRASSPSNSHE
jgi:predicted nuclease of predicted toxin-antitoxin system